MYNFKSDQIIIWDAEYTAWEWSLARNWSRENEYREVVEIWALKVDTKTLEIIDTFHIYIKPIFNPKLSDYFIKLTWIEQDVVDEKWKDFFESMNKFNHWIWGLDCYSFWNDWLVIAENCWLNKFSFPFVKVVFRDARDIFYQYSIETNKYSSWTIHKAIWLESNEKEHTALWDAKNILNTLKNINKKTKINSYQ